MLGDGRRRTTSDKEVPGRRWPTQDRQPGCSRRPPSAGRSQLAQPGPGPAERRGAEPGLAPGSRRLPLSPTWTPSRPPAHRSPGPAPPAGPPGPAPWVGLARGPPGRLPAPDPHLLLLLPGGSAMASLRCLCLLLLFLLAAAAATSPGRLVPYDLLYADGVRAYFARDWGRAAELLQRALHSYAGLRAARRACRGACRREASFLGGPQAAAGPWEAALFGRVLQRADCLQHCLGRRLGAAPSAHRASLTIRRDFEQREPYNYLQVAFFQVGTTTGPPQQPGGGLLPPSPAPGPFVCRGGVLSLGGSPGGPPAGGGGGGRGLASPADRGAVGAARGSGALWVTAGSSWGERRV